MAKVKQDQVPPIKIGQDFIDKSNCRNVPLKFGIEADEGSEFQVTLSTNETFTIKIGKTGIYESDDYLKFYSIVYTKAGDVKTKNPVFDYVIGGK